MKTNGSWGTPPTVTIASTSARPPVGSWSAVAAASLPIQATVSSLQTRLAPRWHIARADVVESALTPVEHQTFCPASKLQIPSEVVADLD